MPTVELVSADSIAPLGNGTAGGSPLDLMQAEEYTLVCLIAVSPLITVPP